MRIVDTAYHGVNDPRGHFFYSYDAGLSWKGLFSFGDLINRFLGAHGRGKDLRNSNVATAISNILGYTVLVYFMGIIGAAVTHIMSGIVYVSTMAYLYIVYTRRVNQLSRLDFDSSH